MNNEFNGQQTPAPQPMPAPAPMPAPMPVQQPSPMPAPQPQMMSVQQSMPQPPMGQPQQTMPMGTTPPKKKINPVLIIVALVAIIGMAFSVWFFVLRDTKEDTRSKSKDKETPQKNQLVELTASEKSSLDEIVKGMQEVNSGSMIINMKMGTEFGSIEMAATMKYDEHGTSHMTTDSSIMGLSSKAETYIMAKDGLIYTYTNTDGAGWIVATSEEYEDQNQISQITSIYEDYTEVKKYTEKENGMTRYALTLSQERTAELFNSLDTEDVENIPTNFTIEIYVKDGYIVKIVVDMSELTKELGMSEYIATITMSDFNAVDTITVPQEIIDGATEEEDEWDF